MQLLEYVCSQTKLDSFESKGIILSGKVYINNEICTSYKHTLKKNDIVTIKYEGKKYVTRSGLKLEKALEVFGVDVVDKICIDIGASEGGFTDCLLQNNVQKVYSVDVAYGLLNWKLRNNEKVVVLERTNARFLNEEKIKEKCDIITADVAFISITKILPNVGKLLKNDGLIISLFKPQFELPSEQIKKNGNIENPQFIVDSINSTIAFLKDQRIFIRKCTYSPICGNNGNIEFLLLGDINNNNKIIIDYDTISSVVFEAFAKLR